MKDHILCSTDLTVTLSSLDIPNLLYTCRQRSLDVSAGSSTQQCCCTLECVKRTLLKCLETFWRATAVASVSGRGTSARFATNANTVCSKVYLHAKLCCIIYPANVTSHMLLDRPPVFASFECLEQ